MLVVDASVIATAMADDADDGDHLRAGRLDARRAALALEDLDALPIYRAPHRRLLLRCWELRDNLTIYDAAYVALAELLDAELLTSDRRLARSAGPRCHIEVVGAGH